MMSNNKILTVSYGTFSCTLEGFEDSFGTMKAIAEYFRDLAQDDRYFGAEPPQPDAEMLARIAEREIARRVEGHSRDGTVVLRAAAPAPLAPFAPAAAAMSTAPATDAPVTSAAAGPNAPEQTPEHHAETAQSDPGALPGGAEAHDTEAHDAQLDTDIAAVMNAVRDETPEPEAAVAPTPEPAETRAGLSAETQPEHAEQEHEAPERIDAQIDAEDTDPLAAIAAELDGSLAAQESAPQDSPQDSLDDAEEENADDIAHVDAFDFVARVHDDTAEDMHEGDEAEDIAPASAAAPAALEPAAPGMARSIAAKLQRIRDVVARNQSAEANGYLEDEHAEDADLAPLDVAETDSAQDDFAALDAALAQPEAGTDRQEMTPDTGGEDTLTGAFEDLDRSLDADRAETQDMAGTDPEPAPVADPVADPAPRQGARVLRIKTSDLKAALDSGALEEIVAAPEEADAPEETAQDAQKDSDDKADAPGTLSDDEEAELLRELAEVEAEIAASLQGSAAEPPAAETSAQPQDAPAPDAEQDAALDHIAATVAADSAATRAEEKASKRQMAAEAAVEESALDRLMAEADTQMDEPEGSSRRAAFDHLRAAVVATKGDDALSAEAASGSDDDAYRTDLAKAVKPRRPKPSDTPYTGTERRAKPRPGPLKLVAEQRVDTPGARLGPVRPRRVASEDMPARAPADGMSFADYASAQGAHALPELLEAAASYLSFVEGREQFSRPQLMTKVRQVGPQDFTREDGLRSFGQLLRAGKIEKIKGGRFTVSGDIGFRPMGTRAAG